MSYDAAKPFHEGRLEWSEERVAELRRMWAEGWSASQIAKALGGTTRNAVIGKVHRLGLEQRGTPSRPVKFKIRSRPLPIQPIVPGAVKLMDLQSWSCRFPCGDPRAKGFGFCGCPRQDESPYCAEHSRLAFTAKPDKRLAMLEREKEAA